MKQKDGKWYEDGTRRGGVTYSCRVRPLVMWVTNQHIDYPGKWIGECFPLFGVKVLNVPSGGIYARDAQEAVTQFVISAIDELAAAVQQIEVSS